PSPTPLLVHSSLLLPPSPTRRRSPPSLHDALPISARSFSASSARPSGSCKGSATHPGGRRNSTKLRGEPCGPIVAFSMSSRPNIDRKSTRLNSSHLVLSYAVFCLKKKKTTFNGWRL